MQPIVSVDSGALRGLRVGSVHHFLGVPYAHASRFSEPRPPQAWSGVRDAVEYGPQAIQQASGNGAGAASSENCQFINIWTPSVDSGVRKPVMYYLHGSGFVGGSGGSGKNPCAAAARRWFFWRSG